MTSSYFALLLRPLTFQEKKIIGVIQRTHGDTKDSHNKSPNNRNWQDMGIHNRQADV
jgi:hypothetical protein